MGFLPIIPGLNLLIDYLLKSSLILCFALFLSYLLRKQSAALRHMLLALSLIGLLFLPFLTSAGGWEARFLPSWYLSSGNSTSADAMISKPGSIETGPMARFQSSSKAQQNPADEKNGFGIGLSAAAKPLKQLL